MLRSFHAPHSIVRLSQVRVLLYQRAIKLLTFAQLARGEQRIRQSEPGREVIGSALHGLPERVSRLPVLSHCRLTGSEIIEPLKLARRQLSRALITDCGRF